MDDKHEDDRHESIIRKVRKLLALSENNPDLNEAKKAAAKAQELMAQHAISQAFLKLEQGDAAGAPITKDYIHRSGRVATWLRVLAHGVCDANGCAMYTTSKVGINCVGEEEDIALVKMLLTYLASEVKHLCKYAVDDENERLRGDCLDRGMPLQGMNKRTGRVFANNFKMGAADALAERLREASKKVADQALLLPNGNYAIAIVTNKLVVAKDHLPKDLVNSTSRYRSNADAYTQGQRAGNRVNLQPKRARLG